MAANPPRDPRAKVELSVVRFFTGKKNFVWTCNKDTKEQAYNDGNVVAVMRITDLMA